MSEPGDPAARADLLAVALCRELVRAAGEGVRIVALTTPLSVVAALAARRLGAPALALAAGFTVLDSEPLPSLSGAGLAGAAASAARGTAMDTFAALALGRVAVVVSPAQLGADGSTNLSRVGGSDERPKVALPGSRGLPENNDSPSFVCYLLPDHSPRRLVERVDFASGPAPSAGRRRVLLTPLGVFDLDPGAGFRARHLHAGVDEAEVAAATGFHLDCSAASSTPPATNEELAVLQAVDELGVRRVELGAASPQELAAILARDAELP